MPQEGRTIAADWTIFPPGTCFEIPGLGKRIVEDTGSAIKELDIDIYFNSHLMAKSFAVKMLDIKLCDDGLKVAKMFGFDIGG